MAGAGRVRAGLSRWWHAPATIEVLVGEADYVRVSVVAFCRFGLLGMVLVLPAVVLSQPHSHPRVMAGVALVLGPAILTMFWLSARSRLGRAALYATICTAALMIGCWIGFVVDAYPTIALAPVVCVAAVTVWVPRRWAALATSLGLSTYLVVSEVRHIDHPLAIWLPVAAFCVLVILDLGFLLDRVHGLSQDERLARGEVERLAGELAELNRTLEERVEAQVGEIEGLGRLRRFLSPQVADAVVTDSLAPHRRQIAVVFCDLRGFTSFSNSSEPEELLDVLEEYYEVVGDELRAFEATVGSFQGDGILAYFNDPVPCDDPAGTAVAMALSLRPRLDALCERWARRGYELGYGIGIAYGFATLVTIGFEGRLDYTPLGPVVNMASRLGDEAGWGEILIDGRASHAVEGRIETEARRLTLKGFRNEVPAYSVRSLDMSE